MDTQSLSSMVFAQASQRPQASYTSPNDLSLAQAKQWMSTHQHGGIVTDTEQTRIPNKRCFQDLVKSNCSRHSKNTPAILR